MESFGGGSYGMEFDFKLYVDLLFKGDLDVMMVVFCGLLCVFVIGLVLLGIYFCY